MSEPLYIYRLECFSACTVIQKTKVSTPGNKMLPKLVSHLFKILLVLHTAHLVGANGQTITFNACLSDKPLLQLFGVTVDACFRTCESWNTCGNVIYVKRAHVCELHRTAVTLIASTCIGRALIDMTHVNYTTPLTSNATYCPELVPSSNEVILGNLQGVGSKRLLVCDPPYVLFGQGDLCCNTSGQWSEFGLCLQTCTLPNATTNMIFHEIRAVEPNGTTVYTNILGQSMDLFENSSILISCTATATLIGPSSVTCVGGSWSTFPVCETVTVTNTMGLPCTQNSECVEVDSECRDGQCWCQPGLSYLARNQACVLPQCEQYADTFQVVFGIGIKDYDIYTKRKSSPEACMALCLTYVPDSDPDYVCMHADYNADFSRCYLSSQLAPSSTVQNSYYLLRDCA